ncbi:hypothetical protein ACLMJK_000751 [Lecanora helva]
MATPTSREPPIKVPPLQFIIALLLIKSRPIGLSRKDFFERLCSRIEERSRPCDDIDGFRHIDTAAHWKAEYERCESTCVGLKARISMLESELEATQNKRLLISQTRSGKHSRDDNAATEALTRLSAKKPRGQDLLHHVYLLQQTLAETVPHQNDLSSEISHTAVAVCNIIGDEEFPSKTSTAASERAIRSGLVDRPSSDAERRSAMRGPADGDFIAFERVFILLLDGLDKLQHMHGFIAADKVAYRYIKIFQYLLSRICHLCTSRAQENADQTVDRSQSTQSRKRMPKCRSCKQANLKCDPRTPTCRNCQRKNMRCDRRVPSSNSVLDPHSLTHAHLATDILKMCELTACLFRHLDITKRTHITILKAISFILFSKIGKGLRHFVFGPNEEGDNGSMIQSSNLDPPSCNYIGRHQIEEDAVIEAQAPYLIWLLERIKPVLSLLDTASADQSTPSLHQPLEKTNDDALFAGDTLQYTLLQAVFGDKARIRHEPTLKMPPAPTDAEMQAWASAKVDVKDWFKHEVWRLIGWDVLRKREWSDPCKE